jgi:hypothetical protein
MTDEFRALDGLTEKYPPLLKGRKPFWRPKTPAIFEKVRIPSWTWTANDIPPVGTRVVTLDVNGAFLAPLSGTVLAHGVLEHTGRISGTPLLPGYYKIRFHPWQFGDGLPSPLGMAPAGETVWVTHYTFELLSQLTRDGLWPECDVLDSWTCEDKCRPSAWADWIRTERAAALLNKDRARYEAVKKGYSQAVQMMLTQPKQESRVISDVHRPDWHHAIRSAHFANTWRKARKALDAGCGPLVMGEVDEITVTEADFRKLFSGTPPVLKLDSTGLILGAMKSKATAVVGEAE